LLDSRALFIIIPFDFLFGAHSLTEARFTHSCFPFALFASQKQKPCLLAGRHACFRKTSLRKENWKEERSI